MGRDELWPVERWWDSYTLDDLCDIMEFVHDHVARPGKRWYHNWSDCGYHYSEFRTGVAQRLYRALINEILRESDLGLVLGERGRCEEVAGGDELEPMISGARQDDESGGSQHDDFMDALDLFRRRGASEAEKRSAIVILAGVLEERRELVKQTLLPKDEGTLFEIANKFNLRHRKANQQADYDTALYFQWIFYWYVSTIRLTDKIIARQAVA